MPPFRRRAVWLAAGVLLAQVIAAAAPAAAAAVCCRRAMSQAALMDCCKPGSHSCPLMKKQHAATEENAAMNSCPGADERVAALVFGGRGVLVIGTTAAIAAPRAMALAETSPAVAESRPTVVDTPPPRG